MENFENKQSRLDNQEFIEKFCDVYANELEDIVTKPGSNFSSDELGFVNNFRESKKIPKGYKLFSDLLVRIGQDFRLTQNEIDVLKGRFLE